MKLNHIIFSMIMLISLSKTYGQNKAIDSLVRMPYKTFNQWLGKNSKNLNHEDVINLSLSIRERIKNEEGVSSKGLIEFLNTAKYSDTTKLAFIDTILPNIADDKFLLIKLYGYKNHYLHDGPFSNEHLNQLNALEMEPILNAESIRLNKFLLYTYNLIGDYYRKSKNINKAIEYYRKTQKFPFYLAEGYHDRLDFENLYVAAFIGHVKALEGDLKRLKELRFILAAEDRVCPTLKFYIEAAGGKCDQCD